MDDSPSIASLIPDLFKIPRPITDGSSPLIVSANLLHIDVIQMLPILEGLHFKIDSSTKIKMYATLGGYSVLDAILKADPKDYMKLLWTPCKDFPVWIGSVKYTDTLQRPVECARYYKIWRCSGRRFGNNSCSRDIARDYHVIQKGCNKINPQCYKRSVRRRSPFRANCP